MTSLPPQIGPGGSGKVFCIGLSRTGTTSICHALEVLGYRTLHFSMELFVAPEIISPDLHYKPAAPLSEVWQRELQHVVDLVRGRADSLMFSKYDAMGDIPIARFYRELDKNFPGSKFILTRRDEERWLKSMRWMYEEGSVLWNHGVLEDELKFQTYGTTQFDAEIMRRAYRQHNEEVSAYFSARPDDLLDMNIDEVAPNFEQLCQFLDKPLPAVPFPVSNVRRSASMISSILHRAKRRLAFYGPVARSVNALFRAGDKTAPR